LHEQQASEDAQGNIHRPVPPTIEWASVESLLLSLGCKLVEGKGSAVRFTLNGVTAYFHRPTLQKKQKNTS
jgi:hypothetical protein